MATPRRHRDVGYARAIAGDHLRRAAARRTPTWSTAVTAWPTASSGRGYLYQLAAGLGWTSLPFLPLIRQPTLVMAGADDPIIPLVNARIMARLLPDARLHVYPDGHLGLLTRADELAAVVAGVPTA